MSGELTPEGRREILDAIKQGRKIEAIKLYRDATGAGLKDAKDFIEELTAALPEDDRPASSGGCAGMLLVLALLIAGLCLVA